MRRILCSAVFCLMVFCSGAPQAADLVLVEDGVAKPLDKIRALYGRGANKPTIELRRSPEGPSLLGLRVGDVLRLFGPNRQPSAAHPDDVSSNCGKRRIVTARSGSLTV